MTFIRPQTNHVIQAWMLIPANYQDTLNARFKNNGYGPNTFSIGLSMSGNLPAQAYHAMTCIRKENLNEFLWLMQNFPRMWVWIRVRNEHLLRLKEYFRDLLDDNFSAEDFKRLDYTERDNAYVYIDDAKINVDVALRFIKNNAVPSVNLQIIEPS